MFNKRLFRFLTIFFIVLPIVFGLGANSVAGDGSWTDRTIFNFNTSDVKI